MCGNQLIKKRLNKTDIRTFSANEYMYMTHERTGHQLTYHNVIPSASSMQPSKQLSNSSLSWHQSKWPTVLS